jgi:CBS-domain-containing membrane protein
MKSVRNIMTEAVVVAEEQAPFKELLDLMHEHHVSAIPIVDRGSRLIGIVSEADLLLKEARASGDAEPIFETRRSRIEREKAEGSVAAHLMSSPVVTVGAGATVAEAARIMHDRGVKRLPVVDDDQRVIGIVSRSDLLTVFLRPDSEIANEVDDGVLRGTMWLEPGTVHASVHEGVVKLKGQVESKSQMFMLIGLVRGIEGVVGVDSELTYQVDDTSEDRELAWSRWFGVIPTRR